MHRNKVKLNELNYILNKLIISSAKFDRNLKIKLGKNKHNLWSWIVNLSKIFILFKEYFSYNFRIYSAYYAPRLFHCFFLKLVRFPFMFESKRWSISAASYWNKNKIRSKFEFYDLKFFTSKTPSSRFRSPVFLDLS